MHGNVELSSFIERILVGHNNKINDIQTYPEMSSIYGIKQKSCVNFLEYFHVVDGLPPGIGNDIFEGIAIDIVCYIITSLVSEGKLFSTAFVNSIFILCAFTN